jgi:NAD(P)-dependent dehydrogenase (short-subunit alcohol dehydrogenase family)/acyl carrier protein
MAQARHVGKIVVTQPAATELLTESLKSLCGDGTYLVTGGLGGIGLEVAAHLAANGAGALALLGRHATGPHGAATLAALQRLCDTGVQVRCIDADVSEQSDVARALDEVAREMPRLRGIVHAAGVNEDATLAHQSWAHFAHVLGPKLGGAWHLHQLTRGTDLDFFVLFSSASAVLGSAGQANDAAANASLDALAADRRDDGLAAVSIGWGPWDRIGMTSRLDDRDVERMRRQGYRPMAPDRALEAFDLARRSDRAHVTAVHLDRTQLGPRPLLAALAVAPSQTMPAPGAAKGQAGLISRWANTAPAMRRAAMLGFVQAEAGKVLGLAVGTQVPARLPFSELGLDSLMAVELRNAIGVAIDRTLPDTLLFDHPTSDALTDYMLAALPELAPTIEAETDPTPATTTASAADAATIAEMAALSEEDAEALLLAELGEPEATS